MWAKHTCKEIAYINCTGAVLRHLNERFHMNALPTKLNKSQQRDIAKILVNGASLGNDYMARGLSALYRSAMKTSQQDEIMAIALAYGVVSNNEFIVGNRCAYI